MTLSKQQFAHPDIIKRNDNVVHVDFDPDRNVPRCTNCGGTGKVDAREKLHPSYPGRGTKTRKTCPTCKGEG